MTKRPTFSEHYFILFHAAALASDSCKPHRVGSIGPEKLTSCSILEGDRPLYRLLPIRCLSFILFNLKDCITPVGKIQLDRQLLSWFPYRT